MTATDDMLRAFLHARLFELEELDVNAGAAPWTAAGGRVYEANSPRPRHGGIESCTGLFRKIADADAAAAGRNLIFGVSSLGRYLLKTHGVVVTTEGRKVCELCGEQPPCGPLREFVTIWNGHPLYVQEWAP